MTDKLIQLLSRLAVLLMVLALLPVLAVSIIQAMEPLALMATLLFVSAAAYWMRESRQAGHKTPGRPAGVERTPVLPPEEEP